MAKTNIITGQYVRIEQTAASVVLRFFAWVIDAIFLTIASTLFVGMTAGIASSFDTFGEVLIYLSVLIVLSYPLLMEIFIDGQTLGKSLMGIKVICLDGSKPSKTALFLRWILYLVDFGCMFVGLIFIVFSKNSQRLGDLAAGTTVVKLSKNQKPFILRSFIFADQNYAPSYPEATHLSVRQIEAIEHLLYSDNTQRRGPLMNQLALKVENVLGIRAKENDPEKFLNTVYNDFQYYSTI